MLRLLDDAQRCEFSPGVLGHEMLVVAADGRAYRFEVPRP